jgi:hypothetical protein
VTVDVLRFGQGFFLKCSVRLSRCGLPAGACGNRRVAPEKTAVIPKGAHDQCCLEGRNGKPDERRAWSSAFNR